MEVYKLIILYFGVVNVVGFLSMGIDKWKAKKRAWRIPEATLFMIAIIGGAIGSTLGMHVFHHKTKHWYFAYGMPIIVICWIALAYVVFAGPIQFSIF